MPATMTSPARSAISRSRFAHGPSAGSATGPSGRPNRAIVASGQTSSRAPAAAASVAYSSTWSRLASGR